MPPPKRFGREREFERVLDRQQLGREALDRVLVRAGEVVAACLRMFSTSARARATRPSTPAASSSAFFSSAPISGAGSAGASCGIESGEGFSATIGGVAPVGVMERSGCSWVVIGVPVPVLWSLFRAPTTMGTFYTFSTGRPDQNGKAPCEIRSL
jgi:hypothetical protein